MWLSSASGLALDARRKAHPKLAEWAEAAILESLTVFDFPAAHRIRLRATRGLERINRLASIIPDPDCCLRLLSALLAGLDERWITGKVHLDLNP